MPLAITSNCNKTAFLNGSYLQTGMYDMCLRMKEVQSSKNVPDRSLHHVAAHDPTWEKQCKLVVANSKRRMQQTSMGTMSIRVSDLKAINYRA